MKKIFYFFGNYPISCDDTPLYPPLLRGNRGRHSLFPTGYWVITFFAFIFLLSMTHSCSPGTEKGDVLPAILRIGIPPDESKEQLLKHYTPLFDYLSKELGVKYDLIISEDYSSLLNLFHEQKVDLAYFGGFTFVKANALYNAVPLVMRDVDTKFTTTFLVQASNTAKNVEDFRGKKFSFGFKLSTSGHLMPRYFLEQREINPETFFSEVQYSGSHDKTAFLVRDGMIDLGAVNTKIVKTMFHDGRLKRNDLRILWETPPYSNYVFSIQPHFGKIALTKIRDAFLNLSRENETHAKILAEVGANYFLPATLNDFSELKKIIKNMESLE